MLNPYQIKVSPSSDSEVHSELDAPEESVEGSGNFIIEPINPSKYKTYEFYIEYTPIQGT